MRRQPGFTVVAVATLVRLTFNGPSGYLRSVLGALDVRIESQILSGDDKDARSRYGRLSLADRRAIVEILRDTKKDLPEYFRSITQ
jgi:hypothetical protein